MPCCAAKCNLKILPFPDVRMVIISWDWTVVNALKKGQEE